MLNALQNSENESIRNLEISALVRGDEKAKVLKEHGVNPILIRDLYDSEVIQRAASENDIVINTASGFHSGLARSLVLGLGQREKATGRDVYFFHTTGTSNLGDKPVSKTYFEPRILSDKDDLYTYLKTRESIEKYPQRTTDLVAIDSGLETGVKTFLVMSPTIYGIGTGLFNRTSIQIPTIIRTAIKKGKVDVVGDGYGTWDAVHIQDLVDLYELLLRKVLSGEDVPTGKQGIFFSETGDYTWLQLAEGLANELHKQGVLKTAEVNHLSLQEAAQQWGNGSAQYAELGFASNSRSRADLSRELGWKPRKTRGDFAKTFAEEVKVIAAETK